MLLDLGRLVLVSADELPRGQATSRTRLASARGYRPTRVQAVVRAEQNFIETLLSYYPYAYARDTLQDCSHATLAANVVAGLWLGSLPTSKACGSREGRLLRPGGKLFFV